jgi:hypothetical protein
LKESETGDKHFDHKFCKQIPKKPALPACQYAPLFEEEGAKIVAAGCLIVETPVENDEVNSSVSLDDVNSSVSFKDENGSLHMVEPVCSPEEETRTL